MWCTVVNRNYWFFYHVRLHYRTIFRWIFFYFFFFLFFFKPNCDIIDQGKIFLVSYVFDMSLYESRLESRQSTDKDRNTLILHMVGVNLSINSATLRVSRRNSIRYTISFHYYFSTFPFAFASRLETPTWYPMQIPFCITTVEYLLCQWSNVYFIRIFIFKYSTLSTKCDHKKENILFLKKYASLILQQIFIWIYIHFFKRYTVSLNVSSIYANACIKSFTNFFHAR